MNLTHALPSLPSLPVTLLPPLLLAAVMAAGDVRTRRIPNYLTLGGALAGLLFQALVFGWPGLLQGLGGLAVGFGLMLTLYLLGGMGAGDVKGLGALGAWLTPWNSLSLFCYVVIVGGIVALGMVIWRGELRQFFRRAGEFLVNLVLTRGRGVLSPAQPSPSIAGATMPYGVAIALGMAFLVILGPIK
jgi:prepilin peptidase CpaA